jgi:hypothetical protein
MNIQISLIVLFLWFGFSAFASRETDLSAISRQLPKRHAIMRVVAGDLNADGLSDRLVVARSWDEAQNPDVPRPLLVFLRRSNGALDRVARANGVIACRSCGGLAGDPWRRDHPYPAFITVRRGRLSVAEFAGSGWRGWTVTTFQYDPRAARWFLLNCRNKVFRLGHDFPMEFNTATRRDFGSVALEQFGVVRGCWR